MKVHIKQLLADHSMRKDYREWLEDPVTQAVFASAEEDSKAYKVSILSMDAGGLGTALGVVCGRQQVLDEMRSYEALLSNQEVQESFNVNPVEQE